MALCNPQSAGFKSGEVSLGEAGCTPESCGCATLLYQAVHSISRLHLGSGAVRPLSPPPQGAESCDPSVLFDRFES